MARPLGKDVFEGAKFNTSNGELEIIKYHHAREVLVRFTATGFETFASSDNIRRSKVKDLLRPVICDIGYLGGTRFSPKNNLKAYACWNQMIRRCYSDKVQESNPTYKGCSVDADWHNFQTFCTWYKETLPSDGKKYQIDKDILIRGNRVYSAATCLLVTAQENLTEMGDRSLAKIFLFVSPELAITKIRNMSKFCRENNLTTTNMSAVHHGRCGSYKGWKRVKIPLISDKANRND